MKIVGYLLLAVALVAICAAVWRFLTLRNNGTQVLIRELPAQGSHGWRHGVALYSGDHMSFYKLRSLSLGADTVLTRNRITVTGNRQATETEKDFMPTVEVVILFSADGVDYEFAADRHAAMALISWVESAPDKRHVRADIDRLRNRAFRTHS